jgi:hypothetical protein
LACGCDKNRLFGMLSVIEAVMCQMYRYMCTDYKRIIMKRFWDELKKGENDRLIQYLTIHT